MSVPVLVPHPLRAAAAGPAGAVDPSASPARLLHPAATRVAAPLPPDALLAIAAGLATSVGNDDVALPPGQDRSYVRLLATPAYEAWLIAWGPGGELGWHDHGGSEGAVQVVRGRLAERFHDGASSRRVRTRRLHAGRGAAVPANRIHAVWNPDGDVALSVHVYSPPLAAMTFFEHDGSGAAVPTRQVR